MAQNLTINGVTYNSVASLSIPKAAGGSAAFPDTSDADAAVGDIATGKTAYVNGSKITGTAAGGGITAGISYDTINGSGYITAASVYGTSLDNHNFNNSSGSSGGRFTYLTSVSAADVTSIPPSAFQSCAALTSVELGNNLTSIGVYAFSGCNTLVMTNLPDGITTIGLGAFAYCFVSGITNIPSSITTLGNDAFYCANINITNMALPSGLTSIGVRAFGATAALRKVWIPSSCTTITATTNVTGPFYNCNSLLVLYCEAASKPAGWGTYWNYRTSTTQFTVKWGITKAAFDAL